MTERLHTIVCAETAAPDLPLPGDSPPPVAVPPGDVAALEAALADRPRDAVTLLLLDRAALACAPAPLPLRRWREEDPPVLAVLLDDGLSLAESVPWWREGLFDALPLAAGSNAGAALLARARRTARRWRELAEIRQRQQETTRSLQEHRRRLQQELARTSADLAASHDRLAAVNAELSRHMEQLSLLYAVGRELSRARNWDAALERLLAGLASFVDAAGAALVLRPAPGSPFAPRRLYPDDRPAWQRALDRLEQHRRRLPESADGLFTLAVPARRDGSEPTPLTALPLQHGGTCLGYLLLLGLDGETAAAGTVSFLRAVQMILAEEVAAAQTLDRLRELGQFNARVLETVHSGIWVLDADLETVYCNPTARALLTGRPAAPRAEAGEGPDFVIGRGRLDGILPGLQPDGGPLPELLRDGRLALDGVDGPVGDHLRRAAADGFTGEGSVERDDGELVPVLVQASRMPGRRRGEQWLVLVLEDLTVTRELAAERQRADSLQSLVTMTATLAHEIRNPLTGLSTQAELLGDQLPAGDPRKRYLDVIVGEVERMNETITRMLQFTRPYTPRRRETDLAALAADCVALAAPRAAARDVRCRLRVTGEASDPVFLDAPQVKQVILNLLHNAVDASPAGGEVELRLETGVRCVLPGPGGRGVRHLTGCRLLVRDRGPGFGDTDPAQLFRPFYTTKSSGTGLGLSISEKIVTAHGGTITARRRDGWTEFAVQLPAGAPAAASKEQTAS